MSNIPISYDTVVHSDFLIHWTGKDIDKKHDPKWYCQDQSSRTNDHVADLYLRRLRDILTYGLWMTDEGERRFRVGSNVITIPATPKCCFTELKLSESRRHARLYGRLGIGVKRPFLFKRFGRPLAYFGYGEKSHNDKFLEACAADLRDKRMLNFFQPMNRTEELLNYDIYSESEWRILFFEDFLQSRDNLVINPRNKANQKEHAYFNTLAAEQREKLKYLVPLDGWFAMIIYPSGLVKNCAQWDKNYGISEQIERIKRIENDRGNRVEGLANPRRGRWPIEVELDSCRHF